MMLTRMFVVLLVAAMGLAGCSSASGPAFSAYSVALPGAGAAYRVTCYGWLEGPGACRSKAAEICKGRPVRVLSAESGLADASGDHRNDRNLTFQCESPPVAATPAAGPTPATPLPKEIDLDADTNFDTAKAVLKPAATARLDALIRQARDLRIGAVTIDGYTDSTGSEGYNLDLSVRRTEAVADYLRGHDLQAERIVSHGFGKAHPVASNATAAGRARNRRVEIRIETRQ